MALGKKRFLLGSLAAVALAQAALTAHAQTDYPTRPVRLVLGFVPGGLLDKTARIVAQKLTESWNQQIIIDNRPGASGRIGAELASKAPPDGYTLLLSNNTLTTNPVLYDKYPLDPLKDFAAVSLVAISANVLVAHPSVPARTIKDLLVLSRARSTPLTQASAGVGTPGHLAGELLQQTTTYRFVHVPYKGSGQALIDLISGQVDLSFPTLSAGVPLIQSGKLRALGVTSRMRSALMPEVPTIAETGVPGFEVVGWYGIVGPPGLAKHLVGQLSSDIVRAVKSPDVRQKLLTESAEPIGSSPEEFAAYLEEDLRKWSKVVKAANIRLQP